MLLGIWEEILQREVKMIVESDSATCLQAIRSRLSKEMKYIKKHHGVSIAFLHDCMDPAKHHGRQAQKIDGTLNTADIFTKPLDSDTFRRHRSELGLLPRQT